jgi:hypothetical protein
MFHLAESWRQLQVFSGRSRLVYHLYSRRDRVAVGCGSCWRIRSNPYLDVYWRDSFLYLGSDCCPIVSDRRAGVYFRPFVTCPSVTCFI